MWIPENKTLGVQRDQAIIRQTLNTTNTWSLCHSREKEGFTMTAQTKGVVAVTVAVKCPPDKTQDTHLTRSDKYFTNALGCSCRPDWSLCMYNTVTHK